MAFRLWIWMSRVRVPLVAPHRDNRRSYAVVKVRTLVEPCICLGERLHYSIAGLRLRAGKDETVDAGEPFNLIAAESEIAP
jgi:hypothetical protein